MTIEDLICILIEVIPDARIESSPTGELVVYTGLQMPEEGREMEIGQE